VLSPILSVSSAVDLRGLHSFPTRRSSDLDRFHAALPREVVAVRLAVVENVPLSVDLDDAAVVVAAVEHRLVRGLVRVDVHVRVADRKSTRLNSSHVKISYAVFCLKKKRHS